MSEIGIPNRFKILRDSLLPGQYRRPILYALYTKGGCLHDVDLRMAIKSPSIRLPIPQKLSDFLKKTKIGKKLSEIHEGQSNKKEQRFDRKYLASVASLKFSGYIIIDEKTRYVLMSDPGALLRFDMDEGRMRSNTIRSWIALTASVLTAAFAIFG